MECIGTPKIIEKMIDEQEENGEYIFDLMMTQHFKEKMGVYRSILAIIVAGLYYLNMYSSLNGSVFCG